MVLSWTTTLVPHPTKLSKQNGAKYGVSNLFLTRGVSTRIISILGTISGLLNLPFLLPHRPAVTVKLPINAGQNADLGGVYWKLYGIFNRSFLCVLSKPSAGYPSYRIHFISFQFNVIKSPIVLAKTYLWYLVRRARASRYFLHFT